MSKDITKAVSGNITKPVKLANIKKQWLLADATGKVLGRFASKIANLARGKNKPFYTPFLDCGDNIIVTNAEKIMLTREKKKKKMYINYSRIFAGSNHNMQSVNPITINI